jgi:hypothetical protein
VKNVNRRILSVWSRALLYAKAWRTPKKIIVIESDDWGSIRTSTREAYNYLMRKGYKMNASPYSFDALETNEDLQELYHILSLHVDAEGNPACLTANMIMANPDFDKIQNDNFRQYYFEPVNQTLIRYPDRNRVRELWKEGLNKNFFFPQIHAREHIRYWSWIKDLQKQKSETMETFRLGMCGVPLKTSKERTSYYRPLYVDDSILQKENISLEKLIADGFYLFEKEFNIQSESTIAPNCGWTASTENIWAKNGIKYVQGGFLQEHHYNDSIKYIPHYLGQRSRSKDLLYMIRNCGFEPTASFEADYWKSTLKQIERAFRLQTPAIISSHRVNYIGAINRKNRENSLYQLHCLLSAIKQNWPDALFFNSSQLGNEILKNHFNNQLIIDDGSK